MTIYSYQPTLENKFTSFVFQLYVHNGMTSTGDQYELCMRAENVYLPRQGYFGVTAATGGLAGGCSIHCCRINLQFYSFNIFTFSYLFITIFCRLGWCDLV